MIYRKLGHTDLDVSILGFGCGGMFSTLSRGWAPRKMEYLLRVAHELGINFFDTADAYGAGASEEVVGRALQPIRSEILIATKGGHPLKAGSRRALLKRTLYTFGYRPKIRKTHSTTRPQGDYAPDYIAGAVRDSLKRLRVECIDLYQLHSPAAVPYDTASTLDDLKAKGLIRHWGVSCFNPADALAFAETCETIQLRCNAQNFAQSGPVINRLQTGIIGRQPFLGARDSDRTRLLRFAAFCGVHTTLFGTANEHHLRANVTAVELGPLAPGETIVSDGEHLATAVNGGSI
jgi:aryl-alcohol dehydrogenase-like predicted oxidoreductase